MSELAGQPSTLTLDELARAVGCDAGVVRGWLQLGLLRGDGDEFPLLDLERSRLILYAERRGIGAPTAEPARLEARRS